MKKVGFAGAVEVEKLKLFRFLFCLKRIMIYAQAGGRSPQAAAVNCGCLSAHSGVQGSM